MEEVGSVRSIKMNELVKRENLRHGAWCMLFYYPLEHTAYAHWVAPELIDADAETFSAWSCRTWVLYVVADIVASLPKIEESELYSLDRSQWDGNRIIIKWFE